MTYKIRRLSNRTTGQRRDFPVVDGLVSGVTAHCDLVTGLCKQQIYVYFEIY